MSLFFDYYTASLPASPKRVIDVLLSENEYSEPIPTKAFNGYEQAYKIIRGDHVIATVQYGGNTGPNVQAYASGADSIPFSGLIREVFKEHGLVRSDVAADYNEPCAWESLETLALTTADKYRLKVKHEGDFHRKESGRTISIGSRQSACYHRIYEKGKQLKIPDKLNWVRSETEFKPQKTAARLAYAHATPEQILHATKWTQFIYAQLNGPSRTVQLAPAGTIRVPTDDEQTFRHFFAQYSNLLARKLEEFGGDYSELGLFIATNLTNKAP